MTNDAEYLSQYDASRFPSPLVTVDSVLFTLHEGALCVLLVERANPPQQGAWGLPGGFIDLAHDDSTRATALRKLTEKPGFHRHGWSSSTPSPGRIAIRAAGA
jgi:ADP-ribose pyrophosphatase YjhB (NUDIX family)